MSAIEDLKVYKQEAIELLVKLISTPSLSKEEDATGDLLVAYLQGKGVEVQRLKNNVWAKNRHYDSSKPTILLNSHHDTVKPNQGYTRDPFHAGIEGDVLYGLGSNDAGASLVSLMQVFLYFYEKEALSYNFIFAGTAEEEISGKNGMELMKDKFGPIDFAVVGEPTEMNAAIAEKGLMVLDCKAIGKAGHAAREEGESALYKGIDDINWFRSYKFDKESDYLGPIKMSATIIQSGSQHNVVPDVCDFVVDVRTTDAYTNLETLEIIRKHVKSEVTPRSTRLNPSGISAEHPFVVIAQKKGATTYGSPTLSDQALLDVPSLKMGPGKSARSHTADEFILISEIEGAVERYVQIFSELV